MKILVVEDNPISMMLYKEVLEKVGRFEVSLSVDGSNVRDILEHNRPNLIIMDIILPNNNGVDIYKSLSYLLKDIPVLFISADLNSYEISTLTGVPKDQCLSKPFKFDELIIKINSLCKFQKKKQNWLIKQT